MTWESVGMKQGSGKSWGPGEGERTRDTRSGMGGDSSCTILNRAVMGARSKYGGDPVMSSITVQPKLLGVRG